MPDALREITMKKTDLQLKAEIETELHWDPKVNAAQIGVTVDQGAVSLLGTVDTYAEKFAAEDATKRVSGVRTLAQDLAVKLTGPHKRNDSEIAIAVENALEWDVYVPDSIKAKVQHGLVTLEGMCDWNYEREAAERTVRFLTGVTSVINVIAIKPTTSVEAVKEKVEAALQRQATADASSIKIDTSGGKVTLSGSASSWVSIRDAAIAAWAAPGVTEVVDHMKISFVP
jgi:osmotically-inducible protein OsmY